MKATASLVHELTKEQLSIVLSALTDKILDVEHYLIGSKVDDEPGPLDKCCAGHLARYEERKRTYEALTNQKEAVKATLKLFRNSKAEQMTSPAPL